MVLVGFSWFEGCGLKISSAPPRRAGAINTPGGFIRGKAELCVLPVNVGLVDSAFRLALRVPRLRDRLAPLGSPGNGRGCDLGRGTGLTGFDPASSRRRGTSPGRAGFDWATQKGFAGDSMKCRVRPELLLAGRAENGRHKTIVADWTRLHLMIFLNALAESRNPEFKFQELTPTPVFFRGSIIDCSEAKSRIIFAAK